MHCARRCRLRALDGLLALIRSTVYLLLHDDTTLKIQLFTAIRPDKLGFCYTASMFNCTPATATRRDLSVASLFSIGSLAS